jgi:DNA-directed RNA polymerase subunit RPC12/RpoP
MRPRCSRLLTSRKRLQNFLEPILAGLPVWRFVRQRCLACSWQWEDLVPYDSPAYDRDLVRCPECGGRAVTVGVAWELPAASWLEAKRARAFLGEEPDFVAPLRLV